MKKTFAGILAIIMIFTSFSVVANAAVISDHPLTIEELQDIANTPSILVYTPCTGGNGICQMYSQGWAYVYDYETNEYLEEYNLNCAWQCRYCHSVMATSGDPDLGTPIGNYVVVACSEDLGLKAVHFLYVDPDDIQRCNTVHLSGYNFHKSSLL